MPTSRAMAVQFKLALVAMLFASAAAITDRAQAQYIGRYDLYTGFSDLNTPGLNNINQVGFHLQVRYRQSLDILRL